MQSIMLVPISPAPLDCLGGIQQRLGDRFRLPVTVLQNHGLDPSPSYDPSRNQFYSSSLLAALLKLLPRHEGKILAITAGDLYVPVLTYVFGEAQLDGTAALISSHRLDERFYGLPQNDALFRERIVKEAVHELGHTFGLVHCRSFECVMHSSTAVEEIDVKSERFCEACERLLRAAIGPESHPRG